MKFEEKKVKKLNEEIIFVQLNFSFFLKNKNDYLFYKKQTEKK